MSILPHAVLAHTDKHDVLENFSYCIEGVSGAVLDAIHLKLTELQKSASQLAKYNIRSQYLSSKKDIQNTLQALGYFQANIQSQLKKNDQHYTATYTITLGPALTITNFNINLIGEGQQDDHLQVLIGRLTMQKNCIMSTENYQMLKRRLYKLLVAEGYLDAQWKKHTVTIDKIQYTATVDLSLETGHQYKIGPITFSKNPLSAAFLNSYVTFQQKTPYRLQEVQRLQETLKNSSYFEKVVIRTPEHPKEKEIPVNIEVTPVSKHYNAIRMGYITGLGLRIKAEKCIRYLNDRGHQVFIAGESSFTRPVRILGLYSVPGLSPTTQQYHLQAEYNQQHLAYTPTKTSTLALLSVQRYRAIILTAFLKYHNEIFSEEITSNIEHCTRLLIPGFIARITHINWLEAAHNYEIQLHTQIASKILFSEIDLFKTECKFNYFGEYSQYCNLWRKKSYFICRARLGYALESALQRIPPSFAFYAGGLQAPRGHPEYQTSNCLFAYTLEYRHRLSGLLYLNCFTDRHFPLPYNNFKYPSSAGIGLALWIPHIGIAEVSLVRQKSDVFKPYSYNTILRISDEL